MGGGYARFWPIAAAHNEPNLIHLPLFPGDGFQTRTCGGFRMRINGGIRANTQIPAEGAVRSSYVPFIKLKTYS
jgi:hypothetical protein